MNKEKKLPAAIPLFYRMTAGALALTLLLSGCGGAGIHAGSEPDEKAPEAEASYTVPADGDPGNVTCKGSYTADLPTTETVASVGDSVLSSGELNIFYRLAVNGYVPAEGEQGPDFGLPLEGQRKAGTDLTWQQYFLQQALDSWHSVAALEQRSREKLVRQEENFDPNPDLHEKYMHNVPANDILYTKEYFYKPNKMHQDYLDSIPDRLQQLAQEQGYDSVEAMTAGEFGGSTDPDTLTEAVRRANYAYMFYTELTYEAEPTREEVETALPEGDEKQVDVRQLFLSPDQVSQWAPPKTEDAEPMSEEDRWKACEGRLWSMKENWRTHQKSEARFAILARENSQDLSTRMNGGLLSNIRRGQLIGPLDQWCFAPERQPGDVDYVRSRFGWHMLYYCGDRSIHYDEVLSRLRRERMQEQLEQLREDFPMEVDYSRIQLPPVEAEGKLQLARDLLYPDVAHERISEVPVYVQQDYLKAPYGGYSVSSHGCGITSLAMLATYMSDTILTPGMLAARYGMYNSAHGTDANIFYLTPPDMGFYVYDRAFEWPEAEEALRQGRKVINLQHKGYFTRGGHYLVLSEIRDDGDIVIRDSNIYNYKRLEEHSVDHFPPKRFPPSSQGYWIYDYKILNYPICTRCREAEGPLDPEMEKAPKILTGDYICPKCRMAMDRRQSFLSLTGLS